MSHTMEHKQSSNTMGVVVLAAVAGAAAALLFAPKKGTEMRSELKGRYQDTMTRTQQKAKEAQSTASDKLTRAQDKVHSMTSKAQDKAQDAKSKGKNEIDTNHDITKDSSGFTVEIDADKR